MSKLTLSVDDRVVQRAKRHARKNDTSVSALVENYLANLTDPATEDNLDQPLTPIVRSLRGLLKSGNADEYKRYLAKKYR